MRRSMSSTRSIISEISSDADLPLKYFSMTIIPIEYDDEEEDSCLDCPVEYCGGDVRPCCVSGCSVDCSAWDNCELGFFDDLPLPLIGVRLRIDELMGELDSLRKLDRLMIREDDKIRSGEYDGKRNARGDVIRGVRDVCNVDLVGLRMRIRSVEDEVRRLRGREFDELKKIRRRRAYEQF